MKISELIGEMSPPYLHVGDMPVKRLDSMSSTTIEREYQTFDQPVEILGIISHLFTSKKDSILLAFADDELGKERMVPFFQLKFKKQTDLNCDLPGIDMAKLKQVDRVMLSREFRGRGFSSDVYKLLASIGVIVLSDNSQFKDGAELWKKIASDKNYIVRIVDVDGGFLLDDNGEQIKYNGKTPPDDAIWSTGEDFSGQFNLLMLTKNGDLIS